MNRFALYLIFFTLSMSCFSLNDSVQAKSLKSDYKTKSSTTRANKFSASKSSKQEFSFLGCPGNEDSYKEVTKVMEETQTAWNKHDVETLLQYYSPNFITKDGINLEKIRENLNSFWAEYPDAKINSLPSTVKVCGNHAIISLSEETVANGTVEDPKVLPYAPKFRGWIQGVTTLKKTGNSWKIVSEEILSEQMWKFYGPDAEKLLSEGKIKLNVPEPVKEGDNYITQLHYSLPENVQGRALIDKILLTEFPEDEKAPNKDKEKIKAEATKDDDKGVQKKQKELEAIIRSTSDATEDDGLRRLFTANKLGQDELIRAQIELISYDKKGPSFFGIIGMSHRVVPKAIPQKDKSKELTVTKTFHEEAGSSSSSSENEDKSKDKIAG
ncbi:MAG: hypothetical protein SFU25_03345 [Candidatus Caenarcaniphilales bacterium]|nr:hypothetical protein [Candidatus Caenarcaniphilales bacterium]